MKDKDLTVKVEEIIESLEESETSLKQIKKCPYKEVEIAGIYVQRAKRILNLLYNRLINSQSHKNL